MIKLKQTSVLAAIALATLFSCSEDDGPIEEQPTASAVISPAVGGESQPNQVFIDLSKESQVAVARNSYDLAFYSGSSFRVLLNNSTSALATDLDFNDMTTVSAEDTVGWGAKLDIDAIFASLFGPPPAWLPEAATWMDDPSGDLNSTAIAAVSATDSENPVYIINRGKNPDGSARGWKKIRITQNNGAYVLQHADINSSTFEELTINKSSDHDFVFVSFEQGEVNVAPANTEWDLVFSIFTNLLPIDASTRIPYAYKDYILTNEGRVEVATVAITSDVTYENFVAANLATVEFDESRAAIGSDWRVVAQPGSDQETGVKTDIFYVIKDAGDNYYKLRFTRMTDPVSGERGHPQFEYEIVE
ncbi:HmuY family protein [Roseivirga sp.]|uniref:HmuY family protein n=1 Tax=Roseivirga sp. TaxID=1964215 RepID=UPI003B516355